MWLAKIMGLIIKTLTIVTLIQFALDTGSLIRPLELIVQTYEATMQLCFGWVEPYLLTLT